jgi:hypothetical protein
MTSASHRVLPLRASDVRMSVAPVHARRKPLKRRGRCNSSREAAWSGRSRSTFGNRLPSGLAAAAGTRIPSRARPVPIADTPPQPFPRNREGLRLVQPTSHHFGSRSPRLPPSSRDERPSSADRVHRGARRTSLSCSPCTTTIWVLDIAALGQAVGLRGEELVHALQSDTTAFVRSSSVRDAIGPQEPRKSPNGIDDRSTRL